MADGYWQWGVRYGDDEPHVITNEDPARSIAKGSTMTHEVSPALPVAVVVRRWIQTGPWEIA